VYRSKHTASFRRQQVIYFTCKTSDKAVYNYNRTHFILLYIIVIKKWKQVLKKHSESANLRQGQNVNQKSSGIPTRIDGLTWLRMRMSVGYVPNCMYDCLRNAMSKIFRNDEEKEKVIRHARIRSPPKVNHF